MNKSECHDCPESYPNEATNHKNITPFSNITTALSYLNQLRQNGIKVNALKNEITDHLIQQARTERHNNQP